MLRHSRRPKLLALASAALAPACAWGAVLLAVGSAAPDNCLDDPAGPRCSTSTPTLLGAAALGIATVLALIVLGLALGRISENRSERRVARADA